MKKVIFVMIVLCSFQDSYAQGGILGGVAYGVIANRPQAKLKKHFFLNAHVTGQFGISNAIGKDSRTLVPPIYLSAEYGVYTNVTLGVFAGLAKSRSTSIDLYSDADLQSILDNPLSLLNYQPSGSSYYNINYYLLGMSIKYNFVGGKRTNLFIGSRSGYKIARAAETKTGTGHSNNILNNEFNQILGLVDNGSRFLGSAIFGGNFFLDKKMQWAITPEVGFGTGWGDGISSGLQSFLFTLGGTYHIAPRTKTP